MNIPHIPSLAESSFFINHPPLFPECIDCRWYYSSMHLVRIKLGCVALHHITINNLLRYCVAVFSHIQLNAADPAKNDVNLPHLLVHEASVCVITVRLSFFLFLLVLYPSYESTQVASQTML